MRHIDLIEITQGGMLAIDDANHPDITEAVGPARSRSRLRNRLEEAKETTLTEPAMEEAVRIDASDSSGPSKRASFKSTGAAALTTGECRVISNPMRLARSASCSTAKWKLISS